MRKIGILLLAVALMFATNFKLSAQNQDYPSTISLNGGFSLVGAMFKTLEVQDGFKSNSYPALQLTYDHYVTKWFSMGGAASVQSMGYSYNYIDQVSGDETNVSVDVNRINIALRPLFHYGNSGKIDMYSGLRLGYTLWNIKATVDDYDDAGLANSFAPQLILFGMRGYFTENIGANFELAVGSPHYFSLGLNYRFPAKQ